MTILTCKFCNKEIQKYPYQIRKNNFCNRNCQLSYYIKIRSNIVNKCNVTCEFCGKNFHKKPSAINNKNFCNIECRKKYNIENNRIVLYCYQCNKKFSVIKSRINSKFCSKKCMDDYQKRFYLYTTCSYCNKSITVDKTTQKYNKTGKFYCSNKCVSNNQKGYNNPKYKGIVDISSNLRYFYEKNQRPIIFAKYKKKCIICNKMAEQVHHLYPLYKIIEDFIENNTYYNLEIEKDRLKICEIIINDKYNIYNDLNNLITVCKKCHYDFFHNKDWKNKITNGS